MWMMMKDAGEHRTKPTSSAGHLPPVEEAGGRVEILKMIIYIVLAITVLSLVFIYIPLPYNIILTSLVLISFIVASIVIRLNARRQSRADRDDPPDDIIGNRYIDNPSQDSFQDIPLNSTA